MLNYCRNIYGYYRVTGACWFGYGRDGKGFWSYAFLRNSCVLCPNIQSIAQGAAMAEQGDEERHSSHMKASDEERIVGGSAADGADASSRTGGGNRGRKSSTALQGRLSHEGSGRSKVNHFFFNTFGTLPSRPRLQCKRFIICPKKQDNETMKQTPMTIIMHTHLL